MYSYRMILLSGRIGGGGDNELGKGDDPIDWVVVIKQSTARVEDLTCKLVWEQNNINNIYIVLHTQLR